MKLTSWASKPSLNDVTFPSVARYESLLNSIVNLIPREGTVLHVGCGDGRLAGCLARILPAVRFRGVEQFVCKGGSIPIHSYDGREIPFGGKSFDSVLIVDALHGAENPAKVLREARRVARNTIIIKDKASEGLLASTRRLIDRAVAESVSPHIVERLSKNELQDLFSDLGMTLEHWSSAPAGLGGKTNWLLRRTVNFTAVLRVNSRQWRLRHSALPHGSSASASN